MVIHVRPMLGYAHAETQTAWEKSNLVQCAWFNLNCCRNEKYIVGLISRKQSNSTVYHARQ